MSQQNNSSPNKKNISDKKVKSLENKISELFEYLKKVEHKVDIIERVLKR